MEDRLLRKPAGQEFGEQARQISVEVVWIRALR